MFNKTNNYKYLIYTIESNDVANYGTILFNFVKKNWIYRYKKIYSLWNISLIAWHISLKGWKIFDIFYTLFFQYNITYKIKYWFNIIWEDYINQFYKVFVLLANSKAKQWTLIICALILFENFK